MPAGLSADRSTLVLVDAGPTRRRTGSNLVDVRDRPYPPGRAGPYVVELAGAFDYDALSPDGRILYVAEHLDGVSGGGYQVRAVDLPSGLMRDAPIVDKRNLDETMAGWPIDQLRSPGGLVLTLYRGPEHPFIHALQTAEAWAVCIDLPAGDDDAAQRHWGLAASADWRAVYAVNAARGLAVDIDPSELVARRTVTLASASAPVIALAKFGESEGGPVAQQVVATPDGSAVFAAGPDGVMRLDGADLAVEAIVFSGVATSLRSGSCRMRGRCSRCSARTAGSLRSMRRRVISSARCREPATTASSPWSRGADRAAAPQRPSLPVT